MYSSEGMKGLSLPVASHSWLLGPLMLITDSDTILLSCCVCCVDCACLVVAWLCVSVVAPFCQLMIPLSKGETCSSSQIMAWLPGLGGSSTVVCVCVVPVMYDP